MGKLLIYILTEGRGGIEEYVMNLSRYIDNPSSKYGYLVMGETTVYEGEFRKYGVEYYFVPRKMHVLENIRAYRVLFKKLRDEYDTIYFNTSGLYYPIPYIYAIKNNYRIIIHSHSTIGAWPKSLIHKLNRRWINKHSSVKLACSETAGNWMFGKEKFILVPNAIDLEKFAFDEKKRNICRRKYGIEKSFVIGNIGRLHKLKNQVFLVDILYHLSKHRKDSFLILVGDGEMKEPIRRRAENLGVRDRVIFAGSTNTPEDFYSAMDCFVMPSIIEGFPVTLVEAQANGLPCVVSNSVTKETNITGHVKYLSIREAAARWAKELMEVESRYDDIEMLVSKGFSVKGLSQYVDNIIETGRKI